MQHFESSQVRILAYLRILDMQKPADLAAHIGHLAEASTCLAEASACLAEASGRL